nr:MAG TPA: hypothetical protein [Caudoviricetes sp.]
MIPKKVYVGKTKIIRAYQGLTLIFRCMATFIAKRAVAIWHTVTLGIVTSKQFLAQNVIHSARKSDAWASVGVATGAKKEIKQEKLANLVSLKLAQMVKGAAVRMKNMSKLSISTAKVAVFQKSSKNIVHYPMLSSVSQLLSHKQKMRMAQVSEPSNGEPIQAVITRKQSALSGVSPDASPATVTAAGRKVTTKANSSGACWTYPEVINGVLVIKQVFSSTQTNDRVEVT